MRSILGLLVLAGLLLIVIKLIRVRPLFEITVREKGVEVVGQLPGPQAAEVKDFISKLALPKGARIRGVRNNPGFVLRFNDRVPEALQQRIRNFLSLRRSL